MRSGDGVYPPGRFILNSAVHRKGAKFAKVERRTIILRERERHDLQDFACKAARQYRDIKGTIPPLFICVHLCHLRILFFFIRRCTQMQDITTDSSETIRIQEVFFTLVTTFW